MSTSAQAYPEMLADLSDKLAALLAERGIDAERAAEVAFEAVETIRKDYGGQSYYIPMGEYFELAQRDMEIFQKFNRDNVVELAREYKVSVVHIYRIYKAVRKREVLRRQHQLF